MSRKVMGILAGAAKSDITPPVGTMMDGYAERNGPSLGVHDKLFARAVYFQDGSNSLAIVSCDLCWMTQEMISETREEIKLMNVPLDNVIMCATHTHSGPAMVDLLVKPNELSAEYMKSLPHSLAVTVKNASIRTQSVVLRASRSRTNISRNRHRLDGPTDPGVLTISVETEDGRTVAMVLNYACHPTVMGSENLSISADYSGKCSSLVEDAVGDGCVCLFLNGACGDLNPYTCKGIHCNGSFGDLETIGKELAAAVLSRSQSSLIDTSNGICFRTLKTEHLPPLGMQLVLSAASIGKLAILAIPGEPFVETGLALKESNKMRNLLVVGYANGYQGYFPTLESFRQRDYESTSLCWVTEGADSVIRRDGSRLLREVLGS